MPEISVLLPAFNASATISQAVSSTLNALPADGELVVLDDGSTDATAALAQDAADRLGRLDDLRLLSNDSPLGVARGLNRMIAESDSRLIGRMDADDVSLRSRFSRAHRAIDAGDDFVFTQVIKKSGRRWRPNPPMRITPAGFVDELLLTNPVAHSTMLAKRSAVESLGGYRPVPAEDYDMWLRAATAGMRLSRTAGWGLIYRTHPDQLTATSGWFSRSWSDPLVQQAYGDFTQCLLGRRLPRAVTIAMLPDEERRTVSRDFAQTVGTRLAKAEGLHGAVMRRRLKQRLAWIDSAAADFRAAESRRRDDR